MPNANYNCQGGNYSSLGKTNQVGSAPGVIGIIPTTASLVDLRILTLQAGYGRVGNDSLSHGGKVGVCSGCQDCNAKHFTLQDAYEHFPMNCNVRNACSGAHPPPTGEKCMNG